MRNLYAEITTSQPDMDSQPVMRTMFEVDYETPDLIMNWCPGFSTTWATYATLVNILEDFWREWDRVTIFFEVSSEDRTQRYGEGFVATPDMRREI